MRSFLPHHLWRKIVLAMAVAGAAAAGSSLHPPRHTAAGIAAGEHVVNLTIGGIPADQRDAWRRAAIHAPQYLFNCCAQNE